MRIKYKISTHPMSMLVDLIILFTISTLLQSVMDKVAINKVIGAFIVISAFSICVKHMKKLHFILSMILFFSLIFSLFESKNMVQDITEWIYFLGTFFVLLLLLNENGFTLIIDNIKNKIWIISKVVIICCCLILVLMLTGVGYISKWGEGRYFIGLCNEAHTMASVACLIMSFILFRCKIIKKNRLFFLLLSLIPIYAILETGARIFLLPALLYMVLIIRTCISNKWTRLITYVIGGVVVIFLSLQTSMVEKFFYAFNTEYSTGVLDAFTSGRSRFWKADLVSYFDGNMYQLLFGKSFSDVFLVNEKLFGIAIGSHNDIIYLLHGTGILGTVVYSYIIIKILAVLKRRIRKNGVWLLCCLYMLIPMLMNGFFTYQHYVYSFVILYASVSVEKYYRNEI